MTPTKLIVALCAFSLTLVACQTSPASAALTADTLGQVAAILDADSSGVVTNSELKGAAGGNIALWTAIIGGGVALLSGGGALAAHGKASKAQKDTDDLYDHQIGKGGA